MAASIGNSLVLRILSALVLTPIVLACLIYGGVPFMILISLAIFISMFEWIKMSLLSPNPNGYGLAGLIYIVFCLGSLTLMRLGPDGLGLTLCLLLAIWSSDIGAYFTGKTFGGPKMARRISPNKTWSGFFGGLICSAACVVLYAVYLPLTNNSFGPGATGNFDIRFPTGLTICELVLLGASITVTGQAGDLLISAMKRKVGVKDTGTLIPGHGGLLDRIDSLLLAAPIYYLSLKALGL